MRTILFRAISASGGTTGQWVYGSYVRCGEGHLIVDNDGKPTAVMDWTVGQFTGILDKRGTRIYEGDIVTDRMTKINTYDNGRSEIRYSVVYHVDGFRTQSHTPYITQRVTGILPGPKQQAYKWWRKCEVIGNIIYNGDLLVEQAMEDEKTQAVKAVAVAAYRFTAQDAEYIDAIRKLHGPESKIAELVCREILKSLRVRAVIAVRNFLGLTCQQCADNLYIDVEEIQDLEADIDERYPNLLKRYERMLGIDHGWYHETKMGGAPAGTLFVPSKTSASSGTPGVDWSGPKLGVNFINHNSKC